MIVTLLGMLLGLALRQAGVFRRTHRPRMMVLAERVEPEPMKFLDAVTFGLARVDGSCTVCGGAWTPDHDARPHPPWVRRVPMPGPPARRSG